MHMDRLVIVTQFQQNGAEGSAGRVEQSGTGTVPCGDTAVLEPPCSVPSPPRWVHYPEVPPAAQRPPPAHLLPLRTLEKILDKYCIAMAHFVPLLWVQVITDVLRCLGDTRCPARGLPGGSGTSQTSTRYRVQSSGCVTVSTSAAPSTRLWSPALQPLFLSVSPGESLES